MYILLNLLEKCMKLDASRGVLRFFWGGKDVWLEILTNYCKRTKFVTRIQTKFSVSPSNQ